MNSKILISHIAFLFKKILFKIFPKNVMYIGKYTYGMPKIVNFGDGCFLRVGKFCSISGNVTIFLKAEHRVDWVSTYPFPYFFTKWPSAMNIRGHPKCKGDVIIGNDVWIGYGANILSGVKVGDGAVIGAFSLVTKDVAPYTVVGGNPAKEIRKRFDDELIEKLLKLKWWDWDEEKIMKNIHDICSSNLEQFLKKNN